MSSPASSRAAATTTSRCSSRAPRRVGSCGRGARGRARPAGGAGGRSRARALARRFRARRSCRPRGGGSAPAGRAACRSARVSSGPSRRIGEDLRADARDGAAQHVLGHALLDLRPCRQERERASECSRRPTAAMYSRNVKAQPVRALRRATVVGRSDSGDSEQILVWIERSRVRSGPSVASSTPRTPSAEPRADDYLWRGTRSTTASPRRTRRSRRGRCREEDGRPARRQAVPPRGAPRAAREALLRSVEARCG